MRYVIIGFGAVGSTAAAKLRVLDPESDVIVLNGEAHPFYLRLDLANVLKGDEPEKLIARKAEFWSENRIEIVQDRAVGIDAKSKVVRTASGKDVSYDRLLLGVGANANRLKVPGRELAGIHCYRTLDDAKALKLLAGEKRKVVIVGGGILGMEIAAAAREYDWEITLLVREEHVGAPLLDAESGEFVQRAMQSKFNLILNDTVKAYSGESGKVAGVMTNGGRSLEADLVVECIGVSPPLEFVEDLAITHDGRIRVNANMESALPGVYAAGDAAVVCSEGSEDVFCHTWNVAITQAKTAAENMAGEERVWSEGIVMNRDAFYTCEFSMLGPWERRHGEGKILHTMTTENAFRGVVTKEGVIESALLVGDKTGDKVIRKMMMKKEAMTGTIEELFAEG